MRHIMLSLSLTVFIYFSSFNYDLEILFGCEHLKVFKLMTFITTLFLFQEIFPLVKRSPSMNFLIYEYLYKIDNWLDFVE